MITGSKLLLFAVVPRKGLLWEKRDSVEFCGQRIVLPVLGIYLFIIYFHERPSRKNADLVIVLLLRWSGDEGLRFDVKQTLLYECNLDL